jgi:hypothetical protein
MAPRCSREPSFLRRKLRLLNSNSKHQPITAMSIDQNTQQKLAALKELLAEKQKRERESTLHAYEATMARYGMIPFVVIDGPDADAQRERELANYTEAEHWVELQFVDPPARNGWTPRTDPPPAIRTFHHRESQRSR